MNIKAKFREHAYLRYKIIYVIAFLFNLRARALIKRMALFMRTKLMGQANFDPEKEAFLRYFKSNILRIVNNDKYVDASIYNIKQLYGTSNATYSVELILKNADGSTESKKIIGKHLTSKGTNNITGYFLAVYGKNFLQIREVSLPQERIRWELYYAQKMKEAKVGMPEIIHTDLESGYIFEEFVQGKNVDDTVHQIFFKKRITNSQKEFFKEIGQALAEINLKMKIVHGDACPINWIYEEKRGKLFLIDWECAGQGDPAWDLAHLIYEVGADLGMSDETIDLFDDIYLAIIKGYVTVDVNEEIISRIAGYWVHHANSAPSQIHEKIFQHQSIPLPRGFRILRWLHTPVINKHPPVKKKQSALNRLFFQLLKICITSYRFIMLILGKTNPEAVIIARA